ncbi:MAG: GNAT family N-acetyltransferase [Paludibacteraceae bacterium]|nr:GNAT family N-acetyltransferase [Alphaproteobacteria bacterium]MBR6042610.1 GNAT family N-acetyltransferase [Paludibacteraceae bacterium]
MKVVICRDTDWLLSEDAFSIYASCMYHPTYEDYKAQMEGYLSNPSVKVFVCEHQRKKTGMMVLCYADTVTEIIGIAVSSKCRRRGIGKQLIQSVMESENLKSVKAQTDDDSIGFYRKCGFTEEKIVMEYPNGATVRYDCVLSN